MDGELLAAESGDVIVDPEKFKGLAGSGADVLVAAEGKLRGGVLVHGIGGDEISVGREIGELGGVQSLAGLEGDDSLDEVVGNRPGLIRGEILRWSKARAEAARGQQHSITKEVSSAGQKPA
jgi:hypothetical protein